VKNNLEATLHTQKIERDQLLEKLRVAESKVRKYNDAVNEAKRK
jgi:hypothetical protein